MQRSRRLGLSLAVAACGLLAVALAHVAMELLSRRAEGEGVYLWHNEEYLQTFTPTNYDRRGSDRVLLCGPSEAREALRFEVFEAELPDTRALQSAQSWGTIADCVLLLEYLDQSYGADALPEHLVLGITYRWLSNEGPHRSTRSDPRRS